MGVILLEGIVILVLVLVGFREAVMNAVPLSLKRAIGVGIGLFILFIGFVDGGLIVQGVACRSSLVPTTRRRSSDIRDRPADRVRPVCARRIRGALIISIACNHHGRQFALVDSRVRPRFRRT